MYDRLARIAVDKSRWATIVCLCSVAIPAYWMRDARIDNSIEVWIGTSGTEYGTYKRFLDKYGNEEFIVIAAEAEDPRGSAARVPAGSAFCQTEFNSFTGCSGRRPRESNLRCPSTGCKRLIVKRKCHNANGQRSIAN